MIDCRNVCFGRLIFNDFFGFGCRRKHRQHIRRFIRCRQNYAAPHNIERVSFVPSENAEGALAAYRAGEVDAVTNADFKPLALKLLTPYDDFQRTTHSALNFYQFNSDKTQFKDVRVRKALAISIERERLTEDELDGASHPAMNFSPFSEKLKLTQDVDQAQKLMSDAGFAEGKDFPAIQLVINRNDVQKRIARAVSKMWKKNLNIETEIIVKETEDYDQALKKMTGKIKHKKTQIDADDLDFSNPHLFLIFCGRIFLIRVLIVQKLPRFGGAFPRILRSCQLNNRQMISFFLGAFER